MRNAGKGCCQCVAQYPRTNLYMYNGNGMSYSTSFVRLFGAFYFSLGVVAKFATFHFQQFTHNANYANEKTTEKCNVFNEEKYAAAVAATLANMSIR